MSADTTPNQDAGASNEVNQPNGSEDEAAAAFAAIEEGADASETNTDQTPADEPDEDADTEADEADPEAESDAEELAEVEIGGKTYKVPAEVEKAVLRQADYSRKMNEVGAKEKVYTERIAEAEKLVEGAEKRAAALAKVQLIDAQIAAYDGVNWEKAEVETPAEAASAAVKLMRLQNARKDAVQDAANVARELTEGQKRLAESKRAEMDAVLTKQLKGWGDELGGKITRYAIETLGYTPDELKAITDPKRVIELDKARRYDALQSAKTTLKAKAADAPQVAKPGAKRVAANPQADAMARLRKDNSQESAEAAFLSRM
jgi:hypothetical protein